MAGFSTVGNSKVINFEQNIDEAGTYSILASDVFPPGFRVISILITTTVAVGGSTINVLKDAMSILHGGVNDAPATDGGEVLPLIDATTTLEFQSSDNLVITVAGVTRSRLCILCCELYERQLTVS